MTLDNKEIQRYLICLEYELENEIKEKIEQAKKNEEYQEILNLKSQLKGINSVIAFSIRGIGYMDKERYSKYINRISEKFNILK